jgi:hypothetical protein
MTILQVFTPLKFNSHIEMRKLFDIGNAMSAEFTALENSLGGPFVSIPSETLQQWNNE